LFIDLHCWTVSSTVILQHFIRQLFEFGCTLSSKDYCHMKPVLP
jgi:hypothetical protein